MGNPDWHVNVQQSPLKIPVDVLPWTFWSEGKWPSRQTGRQSNDHKWFALRKIWCVEKLETHTQSYAHQTTDCLEAWNTHTKLRTPDHWLPGGERYGKEKEPQDLPLDNERGPCGKFCHPVTLCDMSNLIVLQAHFVTTADFVTMWWQSKS